MRESTLLGRHPTDRGKPRGALKSSRRRFSLVLAVLCSVAGLTPLAAAERGRQLEFGVEMARRGLWSEALFRFRRADAEDPENPRILNNLAVAHEAVGQFDEALELYKRAVKLEPANAELKRNYARFVEFYQGFRPREEEGEGEATEKENGTQETETAESSESEEKEGN